MVSLVLMIIAIIMFVGGVLLWPSRHDIKSSIMIFVGLVLGLYIVPEYFGPPESLEGVGWIAGYYALLDWLNTYKSVLYYIGAVLMFLEAAAAASRKWNLENSLRPKRVPEGTSGIVQWQKCILFAFIAALLTLFGTVDALDKYEESQRPNTSQAFIDFEMNTRDVDGIRVRLSKGPVPAQILFEGNMLSETERSKWKATTEAAFLAKKKAAGSDDILIVDQVYSLIAHSHDGKVIDEYIVIVDGRVERPDPEKDTPIVYKGYAFPCTLGEDGTDKWLQEWNQTTLSITLPPSKPLSLPLVHTPPGPAIAPPSPADFITVR